jgi:UDP-N-acetylglucosamine 1-carboxyvinyltransferase
VGTETLVVEGGHRLSGRVAVEGAKNAALPACVAALLTDEPVALHRIPQLRDVSTILFTLTDLGKRVVRRETSVVLSSDRPLAFQANPYSVRQMRASFLVLGPLVARLGRAAVPLPGGCAIGERSVGMHLDGLRGLGARVDERGGLVIVEADRLRGARIDLPFPSVGATEQLLMAAALADGETELRNGALEPEVADLVGLLCKMGARIGLDGRTYRIEGTTELRGAEHAVIPDRMEAGTYLLAGAITDGDVTVDAVDVGDLAPFLDVLNGIGVRLSGSGNRVTVEPGGLRHPVRVETAPHPGFPTDLHPPLAALLALVPGTSVVAETIFEHRHTYADGLRSMGAEIVVDRSRVTISGVDRLSGRAVVAPDIRAGAALVLASLAARGETEIAEPEKIDRGYAAIEERLRSLGARIERRTE